MTPGVIVDTSSFVDYFRYGIGDLIPYLASKDLVVLSRTVRLELLKGTKSQDRKRLLQFCNGLKVIEGLPDANIVEKTLLLLHGRGFDLGIADLLILTDCVQNKLALLTSDSALKNAAKIAKVRVIS